MNPCRNTGKLSLYRSVTILLFHEGRTPPSSSSGGSHSPRSSVRALGILDRWAQKYHTNHDAALIGHTLQLNDVIPYYYTFLFQDCGNAPSVLP